MRKQLQGISLILFGIMLILFSMVNPRLPIVGGIPAFLAFWVGPASGIVGLVFSFLNTALLHGKAAQRRQGDNTPPP